MKGAAIRLLAALSVLFMGQNACAAQRSEPKSLTSFGPDRTASGGRLWPVHTHDNLRAKRARGKRGKRR